jgi:hypothetical protein
MSSGVENRIDKYFREGLENLNVIPPADAWENIARNLPAKKKNRKMFIWIATAASIALFAAVSGWLFLQNPNTSQGNNNLVVVEHHTKSILNQPEYSVEKGSQITIETNNTNTKERNLDKTQFNIKSENKEIIGESRVASRTVKITNNENADQITNNENAEKPLKEGFSQKNNETVSVGKAVNGTSIISTQPQVNEQMAFLDGKELPLLALPVAERSIGTPKKEIVKKDTTPVYDDIFVADDDDAEKPKTDRWDIGSQVAPLYSYRNITDVSNTSGASKSSMDQLEKAMITYSSGVVVGYNASSRLSINTGIYYMKMGQELDNYSSSGSSVKSYRGLNSSGSGAVNSTGKIVTSNEVQYYDMQLVNAQSEYTVGKAAYEPLSQESQKAEQTFEFVEVPFLAKYKVLDRKFGIHLLGGVSAHVLVNNKTTITNSDNSKTAGKTENVETFNYSSSVGFGMVYKVRNNMTFSVEPTFKYYLNSFNTSSDIKLHPYAFGLYSGIFFKF